MDLSPSSVLLVALLLMCGYLHDRATQKPNPNPTASDAKDTVKAFTDRPPAFRLVQGGLWLWHCALILFPTQRTNICRNPELLNPSIFSWSPYTISYIATVFIAVPLRLTAYAQLGKNFTFQLAKPSGLIKTGLYRYMQHPSYTAIIMLLAADVSYLLRADGLAACILPDWIVQTKGLSEVGGVLVLTTLFTLGTFRVRDEEQMMRQTFGREWEEYHQTTKRLIPWVF